MPNGNAVLMKPSQDATVRLCNHRGATIIARNDLGQLPTPEGTPSHKPIPHAMLVDILDSEIKSQGLQIIQQEYSVMSEGNKLFGVLKVKGIEYSDYQLAIGLRASNDKVFPVQLIAGANVFVCDNLAFNGSVIALKRRHTANLDIRMEIMEGVKKALASYYKLSTWIQYAKGVEISTTSAKALILDAACKFEVMPLHLMPNVLKEWETPKHKEFAPRTMWSLHNAFTESFKLLKPHVALQASNELGKMIGTEL